MALNNHAAGVYPALDTDILLFIRDVYMRGTPYTNKAAQHHDFTRDSNTSPWEEDGYKVICICAHFSFCFF